MSSGIAPTRTVTYSCGARVGYGIPWASGEADQPEQPVWYYGFREHLGPDVPDELRPRFRALGETLQKLQAALPQEVSRYRLVMADRGESSPQKLEQLALGSAAGWVTGCTEERDALLRAWRARGDEVIS